MGAKIKPEEKTVYEANSHLDTKSLRYYSENLKKKKNQELLNVGEDSRLCQGSTL